MTEKEEVIECIKALSRIEGINRHISEKGYQKDETIFQSIDTIMKYLMRINKELE